MTGAELEVVMSHLCAAYPSAELSDDTIRVWAEHLEGLRYDTAMTATRRCESKYRWFPAISEWEEVYDSIPVRLGQVTGALCGFCDSDGWTLRTDGAVPCPRCNGPLHEDWAAGKLRPKVRDRVPAGCDPTDGLVDARAALGRRPHDAPRGVGASTRPADQQATR